MQRTPAPPRVILGIGDSFVAGAALVVDGRLVTAASEERYNRTKMAYGWPRTAIQEVLRLGGIAPGDVDAVAIASRVNVWRPEAGPIPGYFEADWGARKNLTLALGSLGARIFGRSRAAQAAYFALKRFSTRTRLREIPRTLVEDHGISAPLHYLDHHLCHAAGAYYCGGVPRATILTLDGGGDGLSGGVYVGEHGKLRRELAVPSYDSIGNWYTYVTHLLGFKAHRHEGKITGLAAYGEPRFADIFRSFAACDNGMIENRARAFHESALRKLRSALPQDAAREDVAASIQCVLEEVCTRFAAYWMERLPASHLGVAGGVFANVKLNQRLFALPACESIFVFPGMGDDGLAVGAALQLAAETCTEPESLVRPLTDVYLGPEFGDGEIRSALEASGVRYRRVTEPAGEVAALLADKKVVARFSGRMEFGPRALGNRSILCHAGDPAVNDWLNRRLQRTEFMPFAPVTLAEEMQDCYRGLEGAEHAARFMTITCDCTDALRKSCPAVVHVDGTARPQLVGPEGDPGYRAILEAYRAQTGYSTIINTSFNMHEEPIVCTPSDAVRAFLQGHLDALVIGNHIALRPSPAPADARVGASTGP